MDAWEWLERAGAHHDVVSWARVYGADWDRAWAECPRGDWLLGIAVRAGGDPRQVVEGACACARFAFEYLPESEHRPRAAVEAAEAWVEGDDDAAARARLAVEIEALVDDAPDPAVGAAAMAALAALRSVQTPEDAPHAAASAVQAALLDAGDCAMMAAMRHAQAVCADLVRRHLDRPALRG